MPRSVFFGLEAAISAMIANGIDETSSEVTSLKDSLAKAKRNVQEPSLSIQKKGGDGVERARKRLVAHDAQRAVLEKELVDGETKVQRLEAKLLWRLPQPGQQSWMPRSLG